MKRAALLLMCSLPLLGAHALSEALSPEDMARASQVLVWNAPQSAPAVQQDDTAGATAFSEPDVPSESGTSFQEIAAPAQLDTAAREEMIDGIIALAKQLYDAAGGKPQRAHYSGDIYVCKNFTVHLFNETARAYRMAEYPDVPLVIPDNLPRAECAPYTYGICWKEISAAEGNPFYAAAQFRYDDSLSAAQNREIAREFLKQAQRGDYFQMAADYYYGVGAHSMIFIADYDPATDTVRWADSNMKGEKKNGERYAYVQYDAVKQIDWFVDAFCRKKFGATIYRLRDDIIKVK